MYKTIEAAKTQWCPFSRVALTAGMNANRTAGMPECGATSNTINYADITDETRCLGDRCAVWIRQTDDVGRCGLINLTAGR